MTAKRDLERRLTDHYATEAPVRAPDWVLERALDAVDQTKQQRPAIGALRRIPVMSTFAKVAAAAVVVVGVVAFGAMAFRPASGPGGPGQTASPSPSPSPVRTPGPSPSNVAPTPPPLSETFTSAIHGISFDHPSGWTAVPATETWTDQTLDFGSKATDVVHDAALRDHLFLTTVSQPLAGKDGEAWGIAAVGGPEECGGSREPITIDGAPGFLCEGGSLAAAWTGDRGYVIRLYTSGDEWWLDQTFDRTWFETVLDSVDLRPEDAVAASASPSSSP